MNGRTDVMLVAFISATRYLCIVSNVVRCLPLVNEIKITEKSARYRRQARLVAVLLSCDAMLHMQPIYVVCQSVCLSVCPSVRHKSVLSAETAKHNHANNAAR